MLARAGGFSVFEDGMRPLFSRRRNWMASEWITQVKAGKLTESCGDLRFH